MIRSGFPVRLALMAGLIAPGLVAAQDDAPRKIELKSADALIFLDLNLIVDEMSLDQVADEAKTAKPAPEQGSKEPAAGSGASNQKGAKPAPAQANPGSQKSPTTQYNRAPRAYQPRNQTQTVVRYRSSDPLGAKFGVVLAGADDALRAQLAIPAGEGVVVISVKPEGLAGQAGLKGNDVITALGDEPAKSVEQAKAKILGLGKGALPLRLIREGKPNQVSLVGPEHGVPDESANYWIGVPVTPVDPTLRSHVPGLPEGVGLVAGDVVADSPAAKASLKKFDILKALGDRPLKDQESLIAAVQAAQGKPTSLEVVRAGSTLRLEVVPVHRDPNRLMLLDLDVELGKIRYPDANYTTTGPVLNGVRFFAHPGTLTQGAGHPNPAVNWSMPVPVFHEDWAAPSSNPAQMARIEALLGEVKALVEDVKKQVEAIKKPDGK